MTAIALTRHLSRGVLRAATEGAAPRADEPEVAPAWDPCVRIGTSGWHYPHWIGRFYPAKSSKEALFSYYARRFDTVEINNSFYRLPAKETLVHWREAAPAGFVFACKASRFITHMKKLKDPAESTARFFETMVTLGRKLGPILFQLPPRWGVDIVRLESFLEALPVVHRYAFEFRDESWFEPAVYEALAAHNAAFCIYHLAGRRSPMRVTADFVYVRMHGPGAAYQGRYDGRALAALARRIAAWRAANKEVYCYFDNDEEGHAAHDALRLKAMVTRRRARR